MSEPISMKMKILNGGNQRREDNNVVDHPSTMSSSRDDTDKYLFDGNFESLDDDQELFLMPKRNTKNSCATFLRVMFYSLIICAVLSTVYLIVKDFLNTPYMHTNSELPPFESTGREDNEMSPNYLWKFDCFPQQSATKEDCIKRGCNWEPLEPFSPAPWCSYPTDFSYYTWSTFNETEFGLSGRATMKKSDTVSPYPNPVTELQIDIYFETENAVRIKIFDPNNSRFEVPLHVNYNASWVKPANVNYQIQTLPTGIQIYRKSGGRDQPLFNSVIAPLIFNDQFLELTTELGTEYVYGIGETVDTLRRSSNWSRTVLFNHDSIPEENKNLYASHPFALSLNHFTGEAHGIFLANSNAMEVILQKQRSSIAATFRTIGGILDFRVFLGPNPSDVMQQYTNVIGKPVLPPYWALGFHLCRFNYNSVNHTAEILENNIKAGIPIDVQWNDLDYMKSHNDFSYDPVKFKGLPDFVKKLHQRGMRYVVLIDPGISASEVAGSYAPYDDGLKQDIFIKNISGKPFVGQVWNPVSTVWPDFSHPNVTHYWMSQINSFHDKIPIDGAWIDMNEPSNFLDGQSDGCPASSNLDHPPYVPHVDGGKLYYKTICMSAKQYGGSHYDLHNLYGLQESISTYNALGDITSERPFLISRSSFPGQGHYGGSWTGDVESTWEDMRKSVPQILSYGLFGIPMVGADICGFNGNTSRELCMRWQQLGAFYPFSRNHNTDDGIPQDPVSMGEDVVAATKETLQVRYSLLPYIYSTFFHAHVTGEPVARPLFYEFPHEPGMYEIETQFMLGPSVLIAPILTPGFADNYTFVTLPSGWWYQHYYPEAIESFDEVKQVRVPHNSIPIFYRGGTIVVTQPPAQTTTASRTNKFEVKAYLSQYGNASGELYWDDGVANSVFSLGTYNHFKLTAKENQLQITIAHWGYDDAAMILGLIAVHGVRGNVTSIMLNNVGLNFSYDSQHSILKVSNMSLSMNDGVTLIWSTVPNDFHPLTSGTRNADLHQTLLQLVTIILCTYSQFYFMYFISCIPAEFEHY